MDLLAFAACTACTSHTWFLGGFKCPDLAALLPSCLHRRRVLLESRGWRVVSVPYYHWADSDSMDTRKGLLTRLLTQTRTTGASVHPTLVPPIPTADVPPAAEPAAALAPPTAPQAEPEPAAGELELGTQEGEPPSPAAPASAGKAPLAELPAGPQAVGEQPQHSPLAEPPAGPQAAPSPAMPIPAAFAAAPATVQRPAAQEEGGRGPPAPTLAASPPAAPVVTPPPAGLAPLQLSPQMPPLRAAPGGSVPAASLAPAGPEASPSALEAAKAAAMELTEHMSGGGGSG